MVRKTIAKGRCSLALRSCPKLDAKAWERLKSLSSIGAIVLLILIATDFSPWSAFRGFANILVKKFVEFEPYISRDINDCFVVLWTRKNPNDFQVIPNNTLASVKATHFNSSWPIKVFVHGFSDTASTTWTRRVRDAYLKNGEHNIFSIDWTTLAISPWYSVVTHNCDYVGIYGAAFINLLLNEFHVPLEQIHLIGASAGAQAAAHIGYHMHGRLSRLTGLDPSGPLFHSPPRRFRLDPSDAQFVDVIHSSGKWVGNDDIMGHVDFFPNLGRAPQPGCEGKESVDLSCSHFRAWYFFSNSITTDGAEFHGLQCDSPQAFVSGSCCLQLDVKTEVMGDRTPNTTRGKYFLYTDVLNPRESIQESTDCQWV